MSRTSNHIDDLVAILDDHTAARQAAHGALDGLAHYLAKRKSLTIAETSKVWSSVCKIRDQIGLDRTRHTQDEGK